MDRIYLYVPFEEKEEVRRLGAHFDAALKCWYLERGQDPQPFGRWLDEGETEEPGEYSIVSESAYVVSAKSRCWRCRARIEVVCIYCAFGSIDGNRYDDFTVSNVTAIDEDLRRQLDRWPFFRFGYSRTQRGRYLANHCQRCGVLQGDYFLHCEPGGAFFALKDAPAGAIELTPLEGRVRLSGDEGFEP